MKMYWTRKASSSWET